MDSYQLINKTPLTCQRKSYILIKGKLFALSPCNVVMVNSLKANVVCSSFFPGRLLVMGEGREIWVDFRKERKLSHAVECKALGGQEEVCGGSRWDCVRGEKASRNKYMTMETATGPPTITEHNGLALEVSHLSRNQSYLKVPDVGKNVLVSEIQPRGLDSQSSIVAAQGSCGVIHTRNSPCKVKPSYSAVPL